MTPELEQRRKRGKRPFDGDTVVIAEADLELLREVLAFTLERLAPLHARVFLFHDWHEHDGYLTQANPVGWPELREATASASALHLGRDDDWGVRLAVYPDSLEWLLRYNVDEEEAGEPRSASGSFDFTCTPGAEVADLLRGVHSRWPERSELRAATTHFEEGYAG